MKNSLIAIIGVIFLIIIIASVFKGIHVGKITIDSVNDIKQQSLDLDKKIEEANTQINQKYAKTLSEIEEATVNLKKVKEEYDSKVGIDHQFGIAQIEKYKIEYLWSRIGGYGKDEGIEKIFLDVKETAIQNTYDIGFTVIGPYASVIDFLYDIENDDELNYRINNFKLEPYVDKNNKARTDILQATFVVENIIVNFN